MPRAGWGAPSVQVLLVLGPPRIPDPAGSALPSRRRRTPGWGGEEAGDAARHTRKKSTRSKETFTAFVDLAVNADPPNQKKNSETHGQPYRKIH